MEIEKIKDLFDCEFIVSDNELYPLQKWHNQLIDKTISEITVADVLKMLRQKEFVNIAMSKAIDFLHENIFVGEMYEGELLEKLSEMDVLFLAPYSGVIKDILGKASKDIDMHEWWYDEEKQEFIEIVKLISEKIEK